MLENLARWIFDLRPQMLSLLAALTFLATFFAARITLEGASPDAPPADPAIRQAASIYDAAFPRARILSVYATASGGARLDSVQGAAWLDHVVADLDALQLGAPEQADKTHLLDDGAVLSRRLAPDGRSALIEAPLREDAAADAESLTAALALIRAQVGPGGPYQLSLLAPVAKPGLSGWISSVGPIVAGVLLLTAGLLAYSASFSLTLLTMGAAVLAIVWQVGCWALLGGHFYPAMRFVPFFVFALVLGHGFAIARHVMRVVAAKLDHADAARSLVKRLAPAGGAALLSISLALIAASSAPVPEMRAALQFGALGAFFAFPALFIAMPLLMAGIPVDAPPAEPVETSSRRPRRMRAGPAMRQASAGPQTIAILAAALALIAALESSARAFGPTDAASLNASTDPEWISMANAAAAGPGSMLASLSVVGRTSPDSCLSYQVLDAVDRLSWRLANIAGVAAVDSLTVRLRGLQAGAHEGNPRWDGLPSASVGALQTMVKIPESAALYDKECRTLIIRVFAAPPFATALKAVDDAVTRFNAENALTAIRFELGGGPLAKALAEQRLLTRYQTGLILAVLTALASVAFFSLKDWRAAAAMSVMGICLFLAAGWAVAQLALGLTAQTLPLVLFALLLPADMALYVLMGWRAADASSAGEMPRRRLWQRDGRALASRAASLALCFSVWIAATDPLARDLGKLGLVTTIIGTLVAIVVIPAASMLVERNLNRRPALQAG